MSGTDFLAGLGRIKAIPAVVRTGYVYFAKHLWKHVSRNPVKIDLKVGTMYLEPWDYVPSRLFFFGTWEPSMSRAMQRVGQDGMVALDIGANIGYYTLLLAGIAGPKGRVFAFEPVPSIREKLECNVAANGLSQVQVFPYGVSDQIEKRDFTFVESNSGASFLGAVSDTGGIELRRISDLLDDEARPHRQDRRRRDGEQGSGFHFDDPRQVSCRLRDLFRDPVQ
jgi:FkbM family methyltransferase